MKHQVHVAIQIVPIGGGHPYPIIDKALEVIAQAGVDHRVGAMETVMQGPYDVLMDVARRAQEACLLAGADDVVVTMKVHARRQGDITWEEKE
jgi:uncharacterized protein YqgV (UPF0045/DUF77 family)